MDAPGFAAPARAHDRLPLLRIERAEHQPARHGHGIRSVEQSFERVDRHGETEICGHGGFHVEQALHAPARVEQRPAAVARLKGNRQLNQLHAVELALRRDHALHHAVFEADGIAERNDGRTLFQRRRIAELERGQIRGRDTYHSKIELAVGGEYFRDFVAPSAQFHSDGPRLADDVITSCDQSARIHDEARAHAVLFSIAPEVRDDGNGFFGALGEGDDIGSFRSGGLLLRRRGEVNRANEKRDAKNFSPKIAAHDAPNLRSGPGMTSGA